MKFKIERPKKSLGFSNILNTLLLNRGVKNPNEFLNLTDKVIEDIYNYDNIELGTHILINHLEKDSNVVILVDNDLDGFTSATVMYNYLKTIKPNIKLSYIIHKNKAHGLTNEVMFDLKERECDLLIIPDASSNDYDEHKRLDEVGNIDIIVLDHHNAEKYSANACVVNNQLSSKVMNKAMTGVGVVYKFCKSVDKELKLEVADNFLDLVAFGMIGDSADLKDLESRYLVSKGLKLIEDGVNKNVFISKIYKAKSFSMKDKCTISGVAFYMCPTVNCIIRGGDHEIKSNLFKAFIGSDEKFEDKIRGKGIVEMSVEDYMLRIYTKLKKQQDKIADEGVEFLSHQIQNYGLDSSEIIVVNGTELEDKTYNRLIVNRLCSKYNKHILLLSKHKSELSGSGAGARNKSITDFRRWCELTGLFSLAQGHAGAFGCSLPSYNINKLYDLIKTIPSTNVLTYTVDDIYNERTLNKSIVSLIGSYAYIWGNKLDEPLFAIEDILIESKDIQLKGANKNTIQFTYNDIVFIKFKSNEEEYNKIIENEVNKFTIICKFKVNEYNGTVTPQAVIEDFDYVKSEKKKVFKF